jgi:hypothetical protein
MSYDFKPIRYWPQPSYVTPKQLHLIYALQKRLGIKPVWNPKLTKLQASQLIASLQEQFSKQLRLI